MAATGVAAGCGVAWGQPGVRAVEAVKFAIASQNAPTGPGGQVFYYFSAKLLTDAPASQSTAEFTVPTLAVASMIRVDASEWEFLSAPLFTQGDLELTYPPGQYVFRVLSGATGATEPVPVGSDRFPADAPAYSPLTFAALSRVDTRVAFTGTVQGFAPAAETNRSAVLVDVVSQGQPYAEYRTELPATATAFSIPAGALPPGRRFTIAVSYLSGIRTQLEGDRYRLAGWARQTTATLDTLPIGCSSADIAQSDGTPVPDGRVDNGDFQAFFAAFFGDAPAPAPGEPPIPGSSPADIAQSDATPLPDGGVDNGDFQAFFAAFFTGCP
jgi:hypothetical protein